MVAEELAAEATQQQEQARGTPAAGKIECRCGGTARFKGLRSHDVVTMSGTTRLLRRYYYCRRCDAGFCPADAGLGLDGSAYTSLVQRQTARLCALAPYAAAAQTLEELCGVCVSASHCQGIVARVGAVAAGFVAEQKRAAFAGQVPPGPSPGVLYVEADGVQTPVIGGWRETKVGVCFEKDARGRRVGKRYVSHLGDAETFGAAWYAMAAHRGAERARVVVVLGDGARWLWDQAQTHFPRAIQILDLWHVLDLWHALERLWGVAHAALGPERTEALCAWVAAQRERLEAGRVDALLGALSALGEQHPGCAAVAEAVTYYRNNRERMDYARYRALGLDVGSGAAESGCKQVVSQRLKGAGMRWREAGAAAIACLRCLLLSGQWGEISRRWPARSPADPVPALT